MICPSCKNKMLLIAKDTTAGWKNFWRCSENKTTGCQDILENPTFYHPMIYINENVLARDWDQFDEDTAWRNL